MASKVLKSLSFFVVVVMLLGIVLTGCGQGTTTDSNSEKDAGTAQNTGTSTQTEPEKEPVTINFTTFRADDQPVMQKMIDKFQEENPLIKVNYQTQKDATAYYQTLKADIASGENVDVFDMNPSVDYTSFINEGYMADLSDLEFNNTYVDSAKQVTSVNGKNYGYLNSVYMILCFYNKDIFKENSLDVPKDFNDLVNIVNKLKEKKYGGVAYCGGDVKGAWLAHALINEEGGPEGWKSYWPKIDDGSMTNLKDNAAVYAALKTLAEINKTKILYDNSNTTKYDQSLALFAQKKAPMMMMGTWELGTADKNFPGIDFGIFAFPTINKANVAYAELAQITCVSAKSRYLNEAKQFVNFIASPASASIYMDGTKSTPTVKGLVASFKGADMLSAQVEKGVSMLPIVSVKNNDLWNNALMAMYENILFKGADLDKEIADLESTLKKADLSNQK